MQLVEPLDLTVNTISLVFAWPVKQSQFWEFGNFGI
jgi:hypothetical protein